MTDLSPVALDLAVSGVVSLAAAGVAFRIGVERRLTRLEKESEQFPPHDLAGRLAAVESGLAALRPIADLLHRHGEDSVRRLFEGGQKA